MIRRESRYSPPSSVKYEQRQGVAATPGTTIASAVASTLSADTLLRQKVKILEVKQEPDVYWMKLAAYKGDPK